MSDDLSQEQAVEGLDAEPARSLTRQLVFPEALAEWHRQILESLQACCQGILGLDPTLTALLAAELQWIDSVSSKEMLPPSPLSAMQMRERLSKDRRLSQFYLVDAILAELRSGYSLNGELFAQLKSVTILAVLALSHINFSQGIAERDQTVEEALRNVRLMANNQREVMIKALSEVDFTQPILTLLQAIKIQREQYANNKQVSVNTGALEALLSRLYKARAKEIKTGTRSTGERQRFQLEARYQEQLDERTQILLLREVLLQRGKVKLTEWEGEEERGTLPEQQTLLVSSQPQGLMDIQARVLQSASVALSMSMRHLQLPANLWIATASQITRLVDALMPQAVDETALPALSILLQLVMGTSSEDLHKLPVWPSTEIKLPAPGSRFADDDGPSKNASGIWRLPHGAYLQRYVEVAHSREHRKLHSFLPKSDLFLQLPLPKWATHLLVGHGWRTLSSSAQVDCLARANERAGTALTMRQLQNYQRAWLQREGIDSAIAGILRGKAAQQCSPMAYSHVPRKDVLQIWRRYLASMGMTAVVLAPELEQGAVGSRLYPSVGELARLLGNYQQYLCARLSGSRQQRPTLTQYHNLLVRHSLLILHLSTAARPVTEMYGRRGDYCLISRFIRLTDKEGRSVSSARLVPLSALAVQQLQAWERYLTYLACQPEPLLAPLVSAAEQALSGAGALLFWAVEAKDGSLEGTEIVTPNSMMRQFENLLPLAPNWHRHSVRSHLLEQGVATEFIDALLGHEEMGTEFTNQYSSAALSDLFTLTDVLDKWHQTLGLKVMGEWTIH